MPYIVDSKYYCDETWEPMFHCVYLSLEEATKMATDQNEGYTSKNYISIGNREPIYTFRVREVSIDAPECWRLKVEAQINDGEFVSVPWEMSKVFLEHIDPVKPTMIRFIRDDKDALRFRFTSMAVGRFLTRFRDYSQDEIESYCAQIGLDMTVSKLQVSNSPDDFERIYLNGPHSCMAYEAKHDRYGDENIHPVRLYGGLDLAVAYITRGEDIVGRTLVWPEKKIHGRIYGDANRIKLRLKEEGYVENWDFTGARLHLDRSKYDEIRAPYVDGGLNGIISECGKYIILSKTEGNIVLESDSGTIYTDHCYVCGTKEQRLDWSDHHENYVCPDHEENEDYD